MRHPLLSLLLAAATMLTACGGGGGDGPRVLAQPQSLQFLPASDGLVGEAVTVRAQASSGLAVVFATRTPAVCTVDSASGVVATLRSGTCTIEANQSGNADWAVAAARQLSFVVNGLTQQIAWAEAPVLKALEQVKVSASANSGLAVAYSSLSPATCAVHASSGELSGLAAGTCTVAADQPGDGHWAAAARRTLDIAVLARPQALALETLPSSLSVGEVGRVQVLAGSGLSVAYTSLNPAVCSVSPVDGRVQALAEGACQIVVAQAGDGVWQAAADLPLSLAVRRVEQILAFAASSSLSVGGSGRVQANASSGLSVRYASLSPAVCAVDAVDGVVSALAAGTCVLTADQPGDAHWAAAAQARLNLAVLLRSQFIGFGPAPSLVVTWSAPVAASASSGLSVAYTSLTPDTCAVQATSGQVTGLAVGTCTIAANQAGDGSWAAARQAIQDLRVDFQSQRIIFGTAPAMLAGQSTSVSAAASSGLPVVFASATPAVCSVQASNGLVTALAAGTCTLTADQAGDALWATAPQQTLNVAVARDPSQAITFGAAPPLLAGGTATVTAVASSGLVVSFASLTPTVCSVDAASGVVFGLANGLCTVEASQAGDLNWSPAPRATLQVAVALRSQFISFGTAPMLSAGGSALAQATASSGMAVAFSSLTPAVCTVQEGSGLVTARTAGTCTLDAQQAGDITYSAALPASQSFYIDFLSQAISFGAAPVLSAIDTGVLSASASSGLVVSLASTTPDVCSIQAGGMVEALRAGTCTVVASQTGNAIWATAASVSQSFAIALAGQSIGFAAAPSLSVQGEAVVNAQATSGLTMAFASLTPAVCSVGSGTGRVSGLAAGTCTIAANQSGNGVWAAAAQAVQSFNVARAVQTIGFSATPSLMAGGTGAIRALASSGLPVSYASLTPGVCAVHASSGALSGLAAGTCTVAANQAGNGAWAAAPQVSLGFAVSINPVQTLQFGPPPRLTLGGTVTVSAVASSGLPVAYSSLTTAVCSVNGSGQVIGLTLGDCTIAANQSGDINYFAAAQQVQILQVQVPEGVTVPMAPTGVTATLGSTIDRVVVAIGAVNSGGSPVTGYTVVSSPAGISVSAGAAPVTVSCPVSCTGYAFSIRASNALGQGAASVAVDVLSHFAVQTVFHEPDTQPRDSIFTGTFTLNSTTGAVSNLVGNLTESMSGNAIGSAPFYDMTLVPLVYQLQSWRDNTQGGRFVASFAKNTTTTFTTMGGGDGWSPAAGVANGGVYAGFPAPYNSSVKNSSVLIFVPDNPLAPLTPAQINLLAYADCAPGGMMGAVCMTATTVAGYGAIGTMSGYPVSQVITRR